MKKGVSSAVCGSTTKYRMGCRCQECVLANKNYWVKFRNENREALRLKYREQHFRNKEKRNEQSRQYGKEHAKERALSLKEKRTVVLSHYSNGTMSCKCCGESIYDFLSLDHINGGGNQHRKEMKGRLEPKLIKLGFPEGYQVLCHNCNMGRRFNNGVCPHKIS